MSQESKYMELTPNHLYSVVDELEKSQEHLLIDMYRPHLEKTLETITTLEEEFDILKKYFNGRFIKILKGENQKGVVVQKMTKKLGLEKKNGKVGS